MSTEGHERPGHPNSIDRNRSIIWARYHVDSEDWVLMAVKTTGKLSPSLVTVALVDRFGKTVLEAMIKASDMVSNDEIFKHGVDQSVVFNAKTFQEVVGNLMEAIGEKAVVAWNADAMQDVFDVLARQNDVAGPQFEAHSVSEEYARFVGDLGADGKYKQKELSVLGISAADECRAVLRTISGMAGASQVMTDALASGKPGWTAEFYKPKVGPTEKLKGLFGFNSAG